MLSIKLGYIFSNCLISYLLLNLLKILYSLIYLTNSY